MGYGSGVEDQRRYGLISEPYDRISFTVRSIYRAFVFLVSSLSKRLYPFLNFTSCHAAASRSQHASRALVPIQHHIRPSV